MLTSVLSLLSCGAVLHLEAENGVLVGVRVEAAIKGFSGKGYVTGWDQEGDRVTLTSNSNAGIYDLKIRYHAEMEKGYEVAVNGKKTAGMFTPTPKGWAVKYAGKVELMQGQNKITLEKGWGWYEVDWIELSPSGTPGALPKPPKATADRNATVKTKQLLAYLIDRYGEATVSGQYGVEDSNLIKSRTGKEPAILGGDFIDYSPSRIQHGADPKKHTEAMIAAAKKGQIVTMSWHWNAPAGLVDKMITDAQGRQVDAKWYKGFYSNAATFSLGHALRDLKSPEYNLLIRDMDAIAKELEKFSMAGIPVLWRPLHEADGKWFWWGAEGPGPYKALYRLMFERLTRVHKLHNLIWVANVMKPDWYPGDDVVDVVGVDAYPSDLSDPLSATWEELQARFKGKKLLAITEFGGVPDPARAFRFGARWSYFVSWLGDLGPKKVSTADLKRIYGSAKIICKPARP